jgi:hypothetical protein
MTKFMMTQWTGAAIMALTVTVGGIAPIHSAAATPLQPAMQKPEMRKATELSARRRPKHRAPHATRQDDRPSYYDRPQYYTPAPFVPFNFGYGMGLGRWPLL